MYHPVLLNPWYDSYAVAKLSAVRDEPPAPKQIVEMAPARCQPEPAACHDDHAQQLAEIERLLRLNDTSCERSLVEIAAEEDDVPLFLRQARA
jgi:hypothetical protein